LADVIDQERQKGKKKKKKTNFSSKKTQYDGRDTEFLRARNRVIKNLFFQSDSFVIDQE